MIYVNYMSHNINLIFPLIITIYTSYIYSYKCQLEYEQYFNKNFQINLTNSKLKIIINV